MIHMSKRMKQSYTRTPSSSQPQPQPVGASPSTCRRSSTGALPFPRPRQHPVGVLRRSSTHCDAPARNKTRSRTPRPRNNSFRFHHHGDDVNNSSNLESSTPNLCSNSNFITDSSELVDRIIKFNISYAPAVSMKDGKDHYCMTSAHSPRSTLDAGKQRSLGELISPSSKDLIEQRQRRRSSSSVSWCDAAKEEYDGINLDLDQTDNFPKSMSASSKISGLSSTIRSREKRRSLSLNAIQMPSDLSLDEDVEYYDTSTGGMTRIRSRKMSAESSAQLSLEQQHRRRNRERQRQSRTHGCRSQSRDEHCNRSRRCNMRDPRGRSLKRVQGNGRDKATTATDVPTPVNLPKEIRPFVHQDDDLKFDKESGRCKKHPSIPIPVTEKLTFQHESSDVIKKNGCLLSAEARVYSDSTDEVGQDLDENTKRKMDMLLRGGQDTSGEAFPHLSKNTKTRGATQEVPPKSSAHSVATYSMIDGPPARGNNMPHKGSSPNGPMDHHKTRESSAPFSNKSSPLLSPRPVLSWEKHEQHPVTVTSSTSCQDTFEGTTESQLEKYLARGSRDIDRHRGSSSNEAESPQGNISKGMRAHSSGAGRNVFRSRDRSGAGQILFDRAHEKLDCIEHQVDSVDINEAELGLALQQMKFRTSPLPPPNSSDVVDMGKTSPSSQKIVSNSNHFQQQQHNYHPQMHQIQVPEQQQVYHQHQVLPNSPRQSQSAKEEVDAEWTKYAVKCSARHNADASKKKERRRSKISSKIPDKLSHNDRTHLAVKNMPFTDSCGDAGIYTGQVNENGRPDGKGSMKYNNGIFYEGTWADGSQEEKALTQYNRIRGGFTSWGGKGKVAVKKSGQTLPWNAHKNDKHDESDTTNVRGMEWVDYIGEAGRYTGEVNNYKQPHGRGIMKYDFGLIAEGEWVCGMLKQNPHEMKPMAIYGGGDPSMFQMQMPHSPPQRLMVPIQQQLQLNATQAQD